MKFLEMLKRGAEKMVTVIMYDASGNPITDSSGNLALSTVGDLLPKGDWGNVTRNEIDDQDNTRYEISGIGSIRYLQISFRDNSSSEAKRLYVAGGAESDAEAVDMLAAAGQREVVFLGDDAIIEYSPSVTRVDLVGDSALSSGTNFVTWAAITE